jgi:NAD(P)-dependent dehydrogenase (short-subunit alcohol dehydrogenase family)
MRSRARVFIAEANERDTEMDPRLTFAVVETRNADLHRHAESSRAAARAGAQRRSRRLAGARIGAARAKPRAVECWPVFPDEPSTVARTAVEIRGHLAQLQEERALALGAGLGEIEATRQLCVRSAVTEIATLRAELFGAQHGWTHANPSSQRSPSALAALNKGGLDAVTRSLATEYTSRGVRINAVAPGVIRTQSTSYEGLADRRIGEVGDIVDAILHLDAATFVTGETLRVDGGRAAGR